MAPILFAPCRFPYYFQGGGSSHGYLANAEPCVAPFSYVVNYDDSKREMHEYPLYAACLLPPLYNYVRKM